MIPMPIPEFPKLVSSSNRLPKSDLNYTGPTITPISCENLS